MVSSFILTSNEYTILYPDINTTLINNFNRKLRIFNNIVLYEQIKTINESIKMVYNKDIYFQNLLLNLFLENNYKHVIKNKTERLSHIIFFKNILYTRIKKCIDFLRLYNINTNQLVYRL
jgi:hypothetical protein